MSLKIFGGNGDLGNGGNDRLQRLQLHPLPRCCILYRSSSEADMSRSGKGVSGFLGSIVG
jgi:hypothetical protein